MCRYLIVVLTASVEPVTVTEGENVTSTCDTSCKLSRSTPIVWFRSEQPVTKPPHVQVGAEEGQELVRSNIVFLDVQCVQIYEANMG